MRGYVGDLELELFELDFGVVRVAFQSDRAQGREPEWVRNGFSSTAACGSARVFALGSSWNWKRNYEN